MANEKGKGTEEMAAWSAMLERTRQVMTQAGWGTVPGGTGVYVLNATPTIQPVTIRTSEELLELFRRFTSDQKEIDLVVRSNQEYGKFLESEAESARGSHCGRR